MVEEEEGEEVEGVELDNKWEGSRVRKLRDMEQALLRASEQGRDQGVCMVGEWVFGNNSPYRQVRTLEGRNQGRFGAQEKGWGLQEEVVLHLVLLVEL